MSTNMFNILELLTGKTSVIASAPNPVPTPTLSHAPNQSPNPARVLAPAPIAIECIKIVWLGNIILVFFMFSCWKDYLI